MLHTIPFHTTLIKKNMYDDVYATMSHVLVYGAIQVHSFGALGCIASNTTIGKETGFSAATVSNVITQLKKAGWVWVELNENGHRKYIQPLLTLEKPAYAKNVEIIKDDEYPSFSPTINELTNHSTVANDHGTVANDHSSGNIDNNINKIKDSLSSSTKVSKVKKVVELVNDSKDINSLIIYFHSKLCPAVPPVFSPYNRKAIDSMLSTVAPSGVQVVRDTIDKAEKLLSLPYAPAKLKVTKIGEFAFQFKAIREYQITSKGTTQETRNF